MRISFNKKLNSIFRGYNSLKNDYSFSSNKKISKYAEDTDIGEPLTAEDIEELSSLTNERRFSKNIVNRNTLSKKSRNKGLHRFSNYDDNSDFFNKYDSVEDFQDALNSYDDKNFVGDYDYDDEYFGDYFDNYVYDDGDDFDEIEEDVEIIITGNQNSKKYKSIISRSRSRLRRYANPIIDVTQPNAWQLLNNLFASAINAEKVQALDPKTDEINDPTFLSVYWYCADICDKGKTGYFHFKNDGNIINPSKPGDRSDPKYNGKSPSFTEGALTNFRMIRKGGQLLLAGHCYNAKSAKVQWRTFRIDRITSWYRDAI